jgi:hypothetical protein
MANAKLRDIARARSGDKGSGANVGIIAYSSEGYAFLVETLTPEVVEAFYKGMGVGEVTRFLLPNLEAMNFLLPNILAGGGSRSLRVDAQGKTLGMALLEMDIDVPDDILSVSMRKDGEL